MVRKHGKEPYHTVVLHGGPGAAGSVFGLAGMISKKFGVLEPMQSKYTIEEQEEELREHDGGSKLKIIAPEKLF